MTLNLVFWQDGSMLRAVGKCCVIMLERAQTAIGKLEMITDAGVCPAPLLSLLAWQRGIERISGESDALFRLRTKYAYDNARDAGSVAGFARIWERLELGTVGQIERSDAENWDLIKVSVNDAIFAATPGLFEELVALYGRTCRRYVFYQIPTAAELGLRPFAFDAELSTMKAQL